MSRLYGILSKMIADSKEPFKIVKEQWANSSSYSAGTKLQDITATTVEGYTFMYWLAVVSNGWVGAPYASAPNNATSPVWTPTAKPSTSGKSLDTYALYIKNDLLA